MTEQTAMLLAEDVPELESGHVQSVAEPRAFPRRGVAVAAGLLGMTAAVTMLASGVGRGVVQGKVGAVVAFDGVTDAKEEDGVKMTFDSIDKNGDGSITVDELRQHGEVIDEGDGDGTMTLDELRQHGEVIDQGDVDGSITVDELRQHDEVIDRSNGEIDSKEFESEDETKGMMEGETSQLDTFGAFDKNGDGQVDGKELRKTLKGFGEEIPEEEANGIIADADRNGDDKIDDGEFVGLLDTEGFKSFGAFDSEHDSLVSKQEKPEDGEDGSPWNEEVTEEDTAKFVIAGADKDGDEKLDYEEFKKAFDD